MLAKPLQFIELSCSTGKFILYTWYSIIHVINLTQHYTVPRKLGVWHRPKAIFTVWELEQGEACRSNQVSITIVADMPAGCLEVLQILKHSPSYQEKQKHVKLTELFWYLTWNYALWSDEGKKKRQIIYWSNIKQSINTWKIASCMLWSINFSKCPGSLLLVWDVVNSIKYLGIFKYESAATEKLSKSYGQITLTLPNINTTTFHSHHILSPKI